MKHFEEQVSQAAARLRNEENSRLRVPGNPRRSGGVSWGWVATPVAAVAGLLWEVLKKVVGVFVLTLAIRN